MDIKQMIRADYQERVALRQDIPSEFKKSLKTHERIPVFVDNLAKEIGKIPDARRKNGQPLRWKLDRRKLKDLVYSMTDLFISSALKHCEDRHKSDLQKALEKEQAEKFKGLNNEGDGVVEELGVEVVSVEERA